MSVLDAPGPSEADPLAPLFEMIARAEAHGVRGAADIQIQTAAGWRRLTSKKGGEQE